MKGHNVLVLNGATMNAIVQEWVNYKLAANVDRVEAATEEGCPIFKIHLKEKEEQKKSA